MRRGVACRLVVWTVVLTASGAEAKPVVIHDSGRTLPIDRFVAPLLDSKTGQARLHPVQPVRTAEALLRTVLPIVTPQMQPGTVAKQTIDQPTLQKPLCIVGSDPRSVNWLRRHRQRLAHIGAVCLLVQAAHIEDLRRVADAACGLPVLPMSGSALAQRLALTRYPVLVSKTTIEQ